MRPATLEETLHRRWGGWKGAVLGKAGLDELERQV
jgi:hypothetical protein